MSKYRFHIDHLSEQRWNELTASFRDASIYQTWAYGSVYWMGRATRVVLERDGEVVAATQLRLARVPGLCGIAFAKWGPMWSRPGTVADPADQERMIAELHREFVRRHGLVLRVLPGHRFNDLPAVEKVLQSGGLHVQDGPETYHTLVRDLSSPPDEIRGSLKRYWRRNLRHAEQAGLEVVEGSQDELFAIFEYLHAEMVRRKCLADPIDVPSLRRAQRHWPDPLKMHLVVVRKNGLPVSASMAHFTGENAVYMHGATGDEALRLNSSYLAIWRIVLAARERGCRRIDLNGVDSRQNPGGYQFKGGLAGKEASERIVHAFQDEGRLLSHLAVTGAEWLRHSARAVAAHRAGI